MNACVNMFYFSYVSSESLELKYLQVSVFTSIYSYGLPDNTYLSTDCTADSYEGSMKA